MTEPDCPTNDLPTNPDEFFGNNTDLPALDPVSPSTPPALERLGPSPFPKGRFPFLGFLATVYEHVAAHSQTRAQR